MKIRFKCAYGAEVFSNTKTPGSSCDRVRRLYRILRASLSPVEQEECEPSKGCFQPFGSSRCNGNENGQVAGRRPEKLQLVCCSEHSGSQTTPEHHGTCIRTILIYSVTMISRARLVVPRAGLLENSCILLSPTLCTYVCPCYQPKMHFENITQPPNVFRRLFISNARKKKEMNVMNTCALPNRLPAQPPFPDRSPTQRSVESTPTGPFVILRGHKTCKRSSTRARRHPHLRSTL